VVRGATITEAGYIRTVRRSLSLDSAFLTLGGGLADGEFKKLSVERRRPHFAHLSSIGKLFCQHDDARIHF
jgi:hypothetical protein